MKVETIQTTYKQRDFTSSNWGILIEYLREVSGMGRGYWYYIHSGYIRAYLPVTAHNVVIDKIIK